MSKQNSAQPQGSEITADFLYKVEIPKVRRGGYDPDYVDNLLDLVIARLDAYEKQSENEQFKNSTDFIISKVDEEMGNPRPVPHFTEDTGAIPSLNEPDTQTTNDNNETAPEAVNEEEAPYGNLVPREAYDELFADLEQTKQDAQNEINKLESALNSALVERDQFKTKAEQLEASASNVSGSEEVEREAKARQASDIIAHAVRLTDEIKAKAKVEATQIIEAAKDAADNIRQETETELVKTRTDIQVLKDRRSAFLSQVLSETDAIRAEVEAYTGRKLM